MFEEEELEEYCCLFDHRGPRTYMMIKYTSLTCSHPMHIHCNYVAINNNVE